MEKLKDTEKIIHDLGNHLTISMGHIRKLSKMIDSFDENHQQEIRSYNIIKSNLEQSIKLVHEYKNLKSLERIKSE